MIRNIYPTEVTTIVYSVKNIKPKKKERKFCVLFSIGSVKYRTDPVEDENGNPVFNTESVLQVESPKDPLVLVATESKEKEFYGRLSIPLNELETSRNRRVFQKLLEPHKKCSKPTAEIHFEAWISKVLTPSGVMPEVMTAAVLEKKKSSGLRSSLVNLVGGTPKLPKKLIIKRNSSGGSFKKGRDFSSCVDLTTRKSGTLPVTYGGAIVPADCQVPEIRIVEEEEEEPKKEPEEKEEDRTPLITGISPNSGPAHGGTRITIRGERLGTCRQDVIGLFVCGSNVLATLEYFGPSKVACTTKPWRPGSGTVVMETQSGGKSISALRFAFESESLPLGVDSGEFLSTSEGVGRSDSLRDAQRRETAATRGHGSPRAGRVDRLQGLLGIQSSRSMLDLTFQDGRSLGKSLQPSPSSHVLSQNADGKRGVGSRQPPIIHIQPFMVPESTPRTPKALHRVSSGADLSLIKDLRGELDTYQTVNSELRTKAYELEDDNKRLRQYIESLLSRVMNRCPEILCNDQK